MNAKSLSVTLVTPKPGGGLVVLDRILSETRSDFTVFPEGFLHSDELGEACRMIARHGKWAVLGMDDHRIQGGKFQTGIIVNPRGEIIGEHTKTSNGRQAFEAGWSTGDSIEVIETEFGKLGLCVCYEIFFPEVSRVLALKGAELIINLIGTPMFDKKWVCKWTSLGSARASENRLFFAGCSHSGDGIPLAFTYAPDGECISLSRGEEESITVELDNQIKYHFSDHYWTQRKPELYARIVEE